jgi:hypothetical protein
VDISNDRERRFELEERWLIAHDLCGLLDQVCNFVGRKVDGRTRLLIGSRFELFNYGVNFGRFSHG